VFGYLESTGLLGSTTLKKKLEEFILFYLSMVWEYTHARFEEGSPHENNLSATLFAHVSVLCLLVSSKGFFARPKLV